MAKLFDDSALVGEPWLVASELRFEARDALLLRAAPVDERFLLSAFAERFSDSDETRWDAERRALVAERVQRFDGIAIGRASCRERLCQYDSISFVAVTFKQHTSYPY